MLNPNTTTRPVFFVFSCLSVGGLSASQIDYALYQAGGRVLLSSQSYNARNPVLMMLNPNTTTVDVLGTVVIDLFQSIFSFGQAVLRPVTQLLSNETQGVASAPFGAEDPSIILEATPRPKALGDCWAMKGSSGSCGRKIKKRQEDSLGSLILPSFPSGSHFILFLFFPFLSSLIAF